MTTDLSFLHQAIHLAHQNMHHGGGPFGAVVVRDGIVIGQGANRVTDKHDPTAHAEIEAIRQACQTIGHWSLQGCQLYSSCEPCPMCLAAAMWARIDQIWYAANRDDARMAGFDDELFYREIQKLPVHRQIPMTQAANPEGRKVLEAWIALADKQPY